MITRELPKSAWQSYFDHVSKQLKETELVELEVASLKLGDQIETEWVPFYGITYDPKDDLVEFVLEGLDHLIKQPTQIFVTEDDGGLRCIDVIDAENNKHIARLKEILKLPPA